MLVIYGCFTGAHFAKIAAGIHLGQYETQDSIWENEEALTTYNWRQVDQVRLRGRDEEGREVYTVGTAFNASVFQHAIRDLFALYGYTPKDYHYVDTSPCVTTLGRYGCWLAGIPGFEQLGSRLLARGMYQSWSALQRLVNDTKLYLDS